MPSDDTDTGSVSVPIWGGDSVLATFSSVILPEVMHAVLVCRLLLMSSDSALDADGAGMDGVSTRDDPLNCELLHDIRGFSHDTRTFYGGALGAVSCNPARTHATLAAAFQNRAGGSGWPGF